MNKVLWVQHISGQGQKWKVSLEFFSMWQCDPGPGLDFLYLPKSEYKECEGPEQWENVTERITESDCKGNWKYGHMDVLGIDETRGIRLRKIQLREEISYQGQWAFIVERRKV